MEGGLVAYGISWGKRGSTLIAAMLAVLIVLGMAAAGSGTRAGGQSVSVIVRAVPGAVAQAEHQVKATGGTVGRQLSIIDGFTAKVPAAAVGRLQRAAGVLTVVTDGRLKLLTDQDPDPGNPSVGAANDPASLRAVTQAIGARKL